MKTRFYPILLLGLASFTHANPNQEAQGWRWYNEPKPVKIQKQPPPEPITPQAFVNTTPPANPQPRTMTATEQMKWFHSYMEEVQNESVINSTDVDKVMEFMYLSKFIEGKTTEYGMSWKEALIKDPSLNYRLEHPTESIARQTQNAMTKQKKINAVQEMQQKGYGLFFVYNGEAPLDKVLAPSIQDFATQYNIELLGISLDGVKLDSINDNRDNQGKLDIDATPALLLVHPSTNEIKPLAYGFISQEELLGRFLNVATDYAPDF